VNESTDAVVGVYESTKDAEAAVHTLLEQGVPAGQVSIVGQDLHSETHVHGFVTTADMAKTGAKGGAWVGGLFGVLTGAALLFVPGVGALIVLGPLAAGAIAAAEGAAAGGGMGAVLGHFIAKKHVPKYSEHLEAGNYLVLRHQPQASDAQTLQQDTNPHRRRAPRRSDHRPRPYRTLRPMPADRPRRSHRCAAGAGRGPSQAANCPPRSVKNYAPSTSLPAPW
jgi:hypothetical protein